MSPPIKMSWPSLLGVLLLTACAGGQSGSEGELPAAPCPLGGALLRGQVTDVADCVAVEVQELVSAGQPLLRSDGSVLFDGTVEPGETLRGRPLRHYAYTHEFQLNESVVVLVVAFDDSIALQLIPLVDERVQIHWGTRSLSATLSELAAPDCPSRMWERYDAADDRSSAAASPTTQNPPPPLSCD